MHDIYDIRISIICIFYKNICVRIFIKHLNDTCTSTKSVSSYHRVKRILQDRVLDHRQSKEWTGNAL